MITPRVAALFGTGHGLVTRRQAVDNGMTPRQVDSLVRSGAWVAVRRGVYALRQAWEDLDEYVGRPRLQGRAVHLAMRRDHVLSHDSAAHELGLDILGRRGEPVHVTRERVTGGRHDHGVKHHLASYSEDQVVARHGIRVLDRARTAVDIAREHGVTHGVASCDSALRQGTTREELWAAFEPMHKWPGSTSVRESMALADPGADNVAESLGRLLVLELGIGRVETQFTLGDGHRVVSCDIRVGRHLFEIDGRIKYRTVANGGVLTGSAEEALWSEKQRQDFVTGFKLGMSRIVWSDFWGHARELAKHRLLREFRDTTARFGSSIEDLMPYIRPRPPRRTSL